MNLIHPDATLVPNLLRLATPSLNYHIFVGDVACDRNTVLADFGGGGNWGPVNVPVASFTLTGVAAHKGTIVAPPITLTDPVPSAGTAYGYYVTDETDAILIACARFDTPIPFLAGGSLNLIPILGDSSAYAS